MHPEEQSSNSTENTSRSKDGGDGAIRSSDPFATVLTDASRTDEVPAGAERIGQYEILREIARGGMGVVHTARQVGINRIVALKMMRAGNFAGRDERQRFRAEVEAAGQLDHPNIVPIYDVGEHAGQPYFSMSFIDGPSLKTRLAEGPLAPLRAAEIMRTIAEAVHHAHCHGIIHRDLKPANILLDVGDQPRITDFGLAKRTASDSGMTATGQILGTPSFMPPEQADGRTGEIGPASDVYALGATLYNILTGRPPFQAATVVDTLRQVVEQDPVPPRRLNADIPLDLELICLKCMEKRPIDRYPSAAALAADLQRFVQGDSISIRSLKLFERLRRTLDRYRDAAELSTWGRILCVFSLIVPIAEILVWAVHRFVADDAYPAAMGVRALQFLTFGYVLWAFRATWWPPQSAAARHLLSQWIAFVLGCFLTVAVVTVTHALENSGRPLNLFASYPYFSLLSGMMWFTLASNFWGRFYAFGTAFFVMAFVIPFSYRWAPLEFGALWGFCLWMTGRQLQRFATQSSSVSALGSGGEARARSEGTP